jgi:hypothetical protein
MKTLNKTATVIFRSIMSELNGTDYIKLDRGGESIMPLVVERIATGIDLAGSAVDIYSFAHYYKQNGDLVPDPDVTFAVSKARPDFVVPMTFQNAIYYSEAIVQENNRWMISTKIQHDLVDFANNWMKNLKWQQDL